MYSAGWVTAHTDRLRRCRSFLDAYLAHAGHDIAFGNSGLAELVIRCEKGTKQTMQIPLPGVDVPDTWYDGLNHELGTWHPDAQQELFCEAWECDNILGCASENTVSAEPNAGLGKYRKHSRRCFCKLTLVCITRQ